MSEPTAPRWQGEKTTVSAILDGVVDAWRQYRHDDGQRTAERTINLIVAPECLGAASQVEQELGQLGVHTSARTVILRQHKHARLDATIELLESDPLGQESSGTFDEHITLSADLERLRAADSLVDPLLVRGLPTIVWLPGGEQGPADTALAALADQVILDSVCGDTDVCRRRALKCLRQVPVYDLAWVRLKYWRARVAAAFQLETWRQRVDQIEAVEVTHMNDAYISALLLVGWLAARAGWQLEHGSGRLSSALGNKRQPIRIELTEDSSAPCLGGIECLTLRTSRDSLEIGRGASTHQSGQAFVQALLGLGMPGYRDALRSLSPAACTPAGGQ